MLEEEDLMPYEVKPIIKETSLNLNDAIQYDSDEDMLTNCLASFKFGDGSTITTESFNAADAHQFIKDPCVIQLELLGMKFVQKRKRRKKKKKKEEKSVRKSKRSYWHQIQ